MGPPITYCQERAETAYRRCFYRPPAGVARAASTEEVAKLALRIAGLFRSSCVALFIGRYAGLAGAQVPERPADTLFAIDHHRASVVEHIVGAWGASLAKSSADVSVDELRGRLNGRAPSSP